VILGPHDSMDAMSKLNPAETMIVPPGDVPWRVPDQAPVRQEWVDPSQPVLRRW